MSIMASVVRLLLQLAEYITDTLRRKMSELDRSNSLDGVELQEKNIKMVGPANVDRISVLPRDVLDSILGCLPLKDAVRTSILSRSWRYKWVTISSLDFDDNSVGGHYEKDLFVHKLVNIVQRVLLSHCGQVENFKFSTCRTPNSWHLYHFNRWIYFLLRNGIRRLTLHYPAESNLILCKLPSTVSYQGLTHLHITNCSFIPPPTFGGFGNLVSLHLIGSTMDGKELENFIRNCPVLESFALTKITNLAQFTIHALKLKYLSLEGEFGNICLESTPILSDISFKMASKKFVSSQLIRHGMTCDLVCALGCLSDLKRLALSGYFLKHLGMSNVPEGLVEYKHLKVLELSNVCVYADIAVILSILTSASNLQELYMSVVDEGYYTRPSEFIKSELHSNCHFNSLQIVKVNVYAVRKKAYIVYWKGELEFIKFLLAHSPILDKFTIETRGLGLEFETAFLGELLQAERASAQLKITYLP